MPTPAPDWIAEVVVTFKPSVLDPQGNTILAALHSLGYGRVQGVRQGKYFTLNFSGRLSRAEVERQLKAICDKLLSNPVIERYRTSLGAAAKERA